MVRLSAPINNAVAPLTRKKKKIAKKSLLEKLLRDLDEQVGHIYVMIRAKEVKVRGAGGGAAVETQSATQRLEEVRPRTMRGISAADAVHSSDSRLAAL